MSDIKDILKGSLARLGVAKQVEAAAAVEKAQKEISKFVDLEDFEVVSFKEGVLKIQTKTTAVSTTIRINWPKIKNQLTEIKVKRLSFTGSVNRRPQ